MKKTLLFVGILIIMLVMLSGNVQEGLSSNKVTNLENGIRNLDADITKLKGFYNESVGAIDASGNIIEKTYGSTLENLRFIDGSTIPEQLRALVKKYKDFDRTVTMKLIFGVAINKLYSKIIINQKELFKSYYEAATNKSETISIRSLTFPSGSREEPRLRSIVYQYSNIPENDPMHMSEGFNRQQILDRFDAGLNERR